MKSRIEGFSEFEHAERDLEQLTQRAFQNVQDDP